MCAERFEVTRLLLIFGQETIEIDAGHEVRAVTFTANGEYLVNGASWCVQVWRVKDGERVATVKVKDVRSVGVSKDGKFIAAGSFWGNVLVWDTATYEQVYADKISGGPTIYAVDFSPDSSRLVSANESNRTATIWDIAGRKKVRTLADRGEVLAAKYSPHDDRIATASEESVRVWDSNDGQLLVDVKVGLKPWHGLHWLNNHLFVKTKGSKIKQIDASTGSTVSEWSVPHDDDSCIALPQHGKYIACSTKDDITFWNTSTHTQPAHIPQSSLTSSIAFSPDDKLAIVAQGHKIIIKTLSLVEVKVRPVFFHYLSVREHLYLFLIHKGPGHSY